jgi:hypothetical protein
LILASKKGKRPESKFKNSLKFFRIPKKVRKGASDIFIEIFGIAKETNT